MGEKTGRPRGRPPGAPNKRTVERERVLVEVAEQIAEALGGEAFGGNAHALLMAVYKNTALEIAVRLDAAKAAIRYETPALSSIDHSSSDGSMTPAQLTPAERKARIAELEAKRSDRSGGS